MARDKVELRIVGGEKENFTSCALCIHEEDSIEICRLRLCVHAFNHLEEKYELKKEPDCRACTHGDEEIDGPNCCECVNGRANNFERQEEKDGRKDTED